MSEKISLDSSEIIFVLISFSFRFNLYFCPVSKMR